MQQPRSLERYCEVPDYLHAGTTRRLEALAATDGSIAGAMENESTRVSRPEAGISGRVPHLARSSLSNIS